MPEFDGRTEKLVDQNPFATKQAKTITRTTYKQIVDDVMDELLTQLHEFHLKETSWKVVSINNVNMDTYKIKAARGSSWIPTPERYSNAKCGLINIKNEDQECFRWCMRYHQSPQQHTAAGSQH